MRKRIEALLIMAIMTAIAMAIYAAGQLAFYGHVSWLHDPSRLLLGIARLRYRRPALHPYMLMRGNI
jgi:hypothetical protein